MNILNQKDISTIVFNRNCLEVLFKLHIINSKKLYESFQIKKNKCLITILKNIEKDIISLKIPFFKINNFVNRHWYLIENGYNVNNLFIISVNELKIILSYDKSKLIEILGLNKTNYHNGINNNREAYILEDKYLLLELRLKILFDNTKYCKKFIDLSIKKMETSEKYHIKNAQNSMLVKTNDKFYSHIPTFLQLIKNNPKSKEIIPRLSFYNNMYKKYVPIYCEMVLPKCLENLIYDFLKDINYLFHMAEKDSIFNSFRHTSGYTCNARYVDTTLIIMNEWEENKKYLQYPGFKCLKILHVKKMKDVINMNKLNIYDAVVVNDSLMKDLIANHETYNIKYRFKRIILYKGITYIFSLPEHLFLWVYEREEERSNSVVRRYVIYSFNENYNKISLDYSFLFNNDNAKINC